MAWLYVIAAAFMDMAWATLLKINGFTQLWANVVMGLCALAPILLLSFAMKTLPLGTTYAVFVGLATMGTALLGIFLGAGVAKSTF
jgi:quaternary ammonium compound-resistance protein SugE